MKTIATAARHIYGEHDHSTGRIVQIGRRIEIRHVDGRYGGGGRALGEAAFRAAMGGRV